jgi:hypothetical protein
MKLVIRLILRQIRDGLSRGQAKINTAVEQSVDPGVYPLYGLADIGYRLRMMTAKIQISKESLDKRNIITVVLAVGHCEPTPRVTLQLGEKIKFHQLQQCMFFQEFSSRFLKHFVGNPPSTSAYNISGTLVRRSMEHIRISYYRQHG